MDDRVQTLAAAAPASSTSISIGLGQASDSLDEPVSYTLDFSAADAAGHMEARSRSRRGRSACATSIRRSNPSCDEEPQFPGLADHIDMKISAPAGRARVRQPQQSVHADARHVCRVGVPGIARRPWRHRGIRALPAGGDGLAAAGRQGDARVARRLPVGIRRHSFLHAALHQAARRRGDALPGR